METIKTARQRMSAEALIDWDSEDFTPPIVAALEEEIADLRAALAQREASQQAPVAAAVQGDATPVDEKAAQQAFEDYFCTTLSCDGGESVELIEACRSAASDAWHEATRRAAAKPDSFQQGRAAGIAEAATMAQDYAQLQLDPDRLEAVQDCAAAIRALTQRAASQDTVPTTVANQAINDALRLASKDSERDAARLDFLEQFTIPLDEGMEIRFLNLDVIFDGPETDLRKAIDAKRAAMAAQQSEKGGA